MLVYSPEEEENFFDQIEQVYLLAESEDVEAAEELLLEIESSIPDPKENCSVGDIMLDNIYSFYDQIAEPEKALPYFLTETQYLKEKIQNGETVKGIVHFLTTGNIYYTLQDLDKAREYFKIAYQLGKKKIFADYHPDFLFMALAAEEDFADFKRNYVPSDDDEEGDELTDEQQDLMDTYCEKGNHEMDEERYNAAADWFQKAYAVLPEPKEDWEATGYITASLGDAYFSAGKFKEAKEQLEIAHEFYGDENSNPFVLLRLGETYFELGDQDKALGYLLSAYKMEGQQLFEDDNKYLKFLKKHHQL